MYLVFIKFVEVVTRALFVIGASYSLKLSGAGQFGIIATLVGLFAFAFNWERHVDIQRRFVGTDSEIFDGAVRAALPFWGLNQFLMLPVFLAVAEAMGHLSVLQLLLAAVIVSCEHVANQSYQMALVSQRYWNFLNIVAAKNIGVLVVVAPTMILAPSRLTLDYVLAVWAIGQAACVCAVVLLWLRIRLDRAPTDGLKLHQRVFAQHRASFTHFQIGFVAIVMLQFDRLTVGTLLPLAETGVYFRHVLAASFVYQFFNVASFNRISPSIFVMAKTGARVGEVLARIVREYFVIAGGALVGLTVAMGIDALAGFAISAHYSLNWALVSILLAGALIRVAADFGALICNAWMREDMVLRRQLAAFVIGAGLLVILTLRTGMVGTAIASVVSAALYLTLIVRAVRALPKVRS